jgi:hypothetical protein
MHGFCHRILHSRLLELEGFTPLCDVISAVAEFMVRVLHSSLLEGFTPLLGLKPRHACVS